MGREPLRAAVALVAGDGLEIAGLDVVPLFLHPLQVFSAGPEVLKSFVSDVQDPLQDSVSELHVGRRWLWRLTRTELGEGHLGTS